MTVQAIDLVKHWCIKALSEPGTEGLEIDSAETTIRRWQIIQNKPFLRQIYVEWYQRIASSISPGDLPALEIGSGAGFMSDYVPHLITSDVLTLPSVELVVDACRRLPFDDEKLRAIA